MDQELAINEDTFLSKVIDLCPESRDWTIRVMLLETSAIRSSRKTGKQYKRFIFVDAEGTKLQACAFDGDIVKMDDCLKLFDTYEIFAETGNRFAISLPRYNPSLQLVLNQRSSIRPIIENPINKIVGKPPFITLSQLEYSLSTNAFIDVIAVLVDVLLPRTKQSPRQNSSPHKEPDRLQEIILITDEKLPIRLTLWNELVDAEGQLLMSIVNERPVIAALNVKASSFAGISLSVVSMANIVINPPYPECEQLIQWKHDSHEYLDQLLLTKPYLTNNQATPSPTVETTTVSKMRQSTKQGKYQCTATFQILTTEKLKMSYSACTKCHTATTTPSKRSFYCFRCSSIQISEPRYLLHVNIQDSTGFVKCVAYENIGTDLLGCKLQDASTKSDKELMEYCTTRNQAVISKNMVFTIKKKPVIPSKFENDGYIITAVDHVTSGDSSSQLTPTKDHLLTQPSTGITPDLHVMTTATTKSSITKPTSGVRKELASLLEMSDHTSSHNESSSDANKVTPSKKTKTNVKKQDIKADEPCP